MFDYSAGHVQMAAPCTGLNGLSKQKRHIICNRNGQ